MKRVDESLLYCNENCVNIDQPYVLPKAAFQPVVIAGKLAFKVDRVRGLIEWQHRGQKYIIDLATLQQLR
jgi:hypothetical protein